MLDKSALKKIFINTHGKSRLLYAYHKNDNSLRKKHEFYLAFLNKHFVASKFTHAYTKRRSIYTNAMLHLNNDIYIKMDVKDFFPSLSHDYLVESMYRELNRKVKQNITLQECKNIVDNSTVNKRGLPLGLLPSPTLSNIYMKKFDIVFYSRLKKIGLDNVLYTRYADDLFISFKSGSVSADTNEIIKLCSRELSKCYLQINENKTKIINLNKSNHVKIAGINITILSGDTRRLSVGRSTVRRLYFNAISAHGSVESISDLEIQQIKGMHSFILSIEKTGYSHCLGKGMKSHISSLGFDSLESLIINLKK